MKITSKLYLTLIATICFSEIGTATASNSSHNQVRVVSLPHQGIAPDSEVDNAGVTHVAYVFNGNVYYTKSEDEGESFSEPVRVNTKLGFAAGGGFRGPDIAVGKDGQIHVVWYNNAYQQSRPKEEWGVMYSRLNAETRRFEKSRNLNQKPSDNFSLAADGSGQVAVIWMAGGVFVNLSKNGGETFESAINLNVDPCECCGSRAIYTKDGSLAVLYRDKTDNIRDVYLARLPSGSRSVISNAKISQTPWPITSCPMTGGFLSQSKTGLTAAWETRNQIYFTSLGNKSGERAPKELFASGKGRYPVSLSTPDGTTLVAWKDGKKLEWQLFNRKSKMLGKGGSINGDTGHRPAGVVTQSGNFLLFP